jgi:hypothetical protein
MMSNSNACSGYQLVNSTDMTSSGIFSAESQQCIQCPFGKYIVRPNQDQCTKCPKGKRGGVADGLKKL